jgi:hypothetical protein
VPEGKDDIPKMEEAEPDHIVVEIGAATIESGDADGGGVVVETGPATIESGDSDGSGGVVIEIGPATIESGGAGDQAAGQGAAGEIHGG